MATRLKSCEAWFQSKKVWLTDFKREYPVIFGIIIFSFIYIMGELGPISRSVDWLLRERAKDKVLQTDFKYLNDLVVELDRNISVLQCWVWALKQNWIIDFYITKSIDNYLNFVNSQSATIGDVYRTEFYGEIVRLYAKFDVAKQKLRAFNTGSQAPDARDRDVDYLRSLINESIGLLRKVATSMKITTYQNRSYLADAWDDKEVLSKNCKKFIAKWRKELWMTTALNYNKKIWLI